MQPMNAIRMTETLEYNVVAVAWVTHTRKLTQADLNSYDLEDLYYKIKSVRQDLLEEEEFLEDDTDDLDTISSQVKLNEAVESIVKPAKATRLARLTSKFKFTRKGNNGFSKLQDPASDQVPSLICSVGTDTASEISETEVSLVKTVPYQQYRHYPCLDDDTRYLTLLAPLVATIQRLSPTVQLTSDQALRASFQDRCEELTDLIKELKKESISSAQSYGHIFDEGNDDMRLLLLNALHKKITLEQSRCSVELPIQLTQAVNNNTLVSVKAIDKNPFILHSSSLNRPNSYTPSSSKPIALPVLGTQNGNFSDFMGHSQQTWRMNVHRLGSFQASALFSPSPIAVNKAMRTGAVRL